jgi:hypothetical protein
LFVRLVRLMWLLVPLSPFLPPPALFEDIFKNPFALH